MEGGKEILYEQLKKLEGKNKSVFLITKSDFCYTAWVLRVSESSVLFKDKFGSEVFLDFSEIKQLGGSHVR